MIWSSSPALFKMSAWIPFQHTCMILCLITSSYGVSLSTLLVKTDRGFQFSSVQLLSRVRLFVTPWIAARQASLSITSSWSSLRLTSIESVIPSSQWCHWVSDAIQPSHPLSSPSLPAPSPSQHQSLFQWVNSSHEVAKVLEFQLQHQSFHWILRADFL